MAIQAPSKRPAGSTDAELRRAFTLGIASVFNPYAVLKLRRENKPYVVVRNSASHVGLRPRVHLNIRHKGVRAATPTR